MKIPWKIFLVLAVFFVQQLPAVSDWGVDLPLLFVVLTGLRTTPSNAAGWGFFIGVVQDLLSAGWIGPNTIAKTFAGLTASFSQMHIYHEKVSTQTFLIFWASVFHQLLIYALMKWDGSAPWTGDALGIGLRTVLMTTVSGAVACFFVVRLRRRRFDPATA
jgi:rod shape-determining protein MreD